MGFITGNNRPNFRTFFSLMCAFLALMCVVASLGIGRVAFAEPAYTINYQGKLADNTGLAVANGTYAMSFALYTQSSGGSAIWSESRTGGNEVTVQNGLFSIMLGEVSSLAAVNFNQALYLGVTIESDGEMTPRKPLGTVPSAFEAKQLGGVASSSFLRSDAADTASGLLTFTGGFQSLASSTITSLTTMTATTTNLVINGERFTDLTGTGLSLSGSTLTASLGTDITAAEIANGDHGFFSYVSGVASLDTGGMTSAELLAALTNETGSGSVVFSASPTFTGTINAAAATLSSTLTMSGSAANIALGSNYLSGDGEDEGIFVDSSGNVGIGTTTPNNLLQVYDLIKFDSADEDTSIGYQAGKNLASGAAHNTFVGYQAGYSSAASSTFAADNNTGVGYWSLFSNTTGFRNTASGVFSLYANTTGYENTAIGTESLLSNTTGYENTANGYQSLYFNSTGYRNAALGFQAGNYITDGFTGNQTSNSSLYLGTYTKALASGDTNEIVIGYNTTGLGSNTAILGNSSITTTALRGNVGIADTTPSQRLDIDGTNPQALMEESTTEFLRVGVGETSNTSVIGWDDSDSLRLGVYDSPTDTTISDLMTILSTGNVGIGTTSPYAKLSVSGRVVAGYYTATSTTATSTFPRLSATQVAFGGDYITDFTGTGLALSGSTLTASLGTDIAAAEIANGDHGFFSYASGVASLDTGGLTSAELLAALTNETGSGNVVFSASPTFTGTLNAAAATLSSTLTMSGSAANIALGSNWLSGDGGDEGIFVNSTGNVGIGTTTPNQLLTVEGNINLSADISAIYFNDTEYFSASTTLYTMMIGSSAGLGNTGTFNDLIGSTAGGTNTGSYNLMIGSSVGASNSGDQNYLIGTIAGQFNSGNNNFLLGGSAGEYNSGDFNLFFGNSTGYDNTGSENIFIGNGAGHWLRSTSSVLVGTGAFGGDWEGAPPFIALNNVALGYHAGYAASTTADNNILLGYQAADNLTTGNNNIIIGYDIDNITATADNRLNIGNLIFGSGIDGTGTTLSSGGIAIGTSTPQSNSKLTVYRTDTTTSANSIYGNYTRVIDSGIVTTGNDLAYGHTISLTRTGATGGTVNSYGLHTTVFGDNAGAGTANTYGASFLVTGGDNQTGVSAALTKNSIGTTTGLSSTITDIAGADTTYGSRVSITDVATFSSGTDNSYGSHITFSNTLASISGTAVVNNYGDYISVTGTTGGTQTNYGTYVTVSGADTNYSGIFMGGNFGIGDSTPSQLFDVDGTNAQALFEESTTEFLRAGVGETAGTSVIGWDDSDSLHLGVYDSPTDTSISDLMTILSTGHVGIGTTAPSTKLHISGDTPGAIRITNTDSTTPGFLDVNDAGSLLYSSNVTGLDAVVDTSKAQWRFQISQLSDSYGVQRSAAGSTWTPIDLFRITSAGSLGVGTTTPAQKLNIFGTNPQGVFNESTTEFLRTGVGETAGTSVIGWDDSDSLRLGVYDSPTDATISDLMTILSTGNVGIGTTSPYAKLSVTNTGSGPSFLVEDATSPDTTPFIIDASGNVGVGTAIPGASLDIAGRMQFNNASNGILLSNDTPLNWGSITDTTGYGFTGNNTGSGTFNAYSRGGMKIFIDTNNNSADNFEIYGNVAYNTGTPYFTILDTGNAGIGDSTPDDLLNIHSASAQAALAITSLGTDTDSLIKFELADGTATFSMGVDDSDSDKFKISGTALGNNDRLVIDSSGNVGIGTSTPSATLSVAGNMTLGTAAANNARFTIYTQDTGSFTEGLVLADRVNQYGSWQNPSGIDGIVVDTNGTPTALTGSLYLNYYSSGNVYLVKGGGDVSVGALGGTSAKLKIRGVTGSTTPLFIVASSTDTQLFNVQPNGNVGIGDINPAAALTVSDNSATVATFSNTGSSGATGGAGMIGYSNDGAALASGDRLGYFLLGGATNGTGALNNSVGIEGFASQNWSGTAAGSYMRFVVQPNGTVGSSNRLEAMRIAQDGKVGIGTTTPAQKLQVYGDIRVGTTGSNGCIEDYGGGVIGGTCSSDERLKENIEPIATEGRSYLESLAALTPVTYNWNDTAVSLYGKNGNVANLGLVAQDVEALFPELVSLNEDGFRQVDFRALPFYIIEAMKELWAKVRGHDERLQSLEQELRDVVQENEHLKVRISDIEGELDIETAPPDVSSPETSPSEPIAPPNTGFIGPIQIDPTPTEPEPPDASVDTPAEPAVANSANDNTAPVDDLPVVGSAGG